MNRQSKQRRTIGSRRFSSDSQRKAVMAQLMSKHQGLVRKEVNSVTRRLGPHGQNLREDLMSAGNEGLLMFARRYNSKRGEFSTGATQAIRSKVQREVQKSKLVRVGEKKVGALAKKGPLPTTVSLSPLSERSTAGGIDRAEARADVSKLISRLSPRERKIFKYRYMDDMTLAQTAKKLRISSVQVKKVESRAMKRLRAESK